jgi:hypothetical protein
MTLPTDAEDLDELDEKDMDALRRCLELAMQESPGRAEQVQSMLEDEPWEQVATFAAYVVQANALRLDPWETPPCCGFGHDMKADRLLRKMLAARITAYERIPPRRCGR